MTRMLSASGGQSPPDQGLCPWTPLGALPPDPHYTLIHMDKSTFVLLYKAMVRPHLEYANSVWCPFKKGDIENIEKVQKRATKLIISLKKLPYLERLRKLKLPTLKYRRLQGLRFLR